MAEKIPSWTPSDERELARLQDEADGDPYAIEQLALAKTDLLVRDMRRQRCEAMS